MIFDVYNPIKTKDGALVPGVKPEPHDWGWIVDNILKNERWCKQIDEYRKTGNKELKSSLPSICFVGRSTTTRQASAMTPTQLFMIDIDHCKDARGAWQKMFEQVGNEWICDNVMLAHLSPSLGIHIIFKQQGFPTLIENMNYVNSIFDFGQYGDYDTKVKDFSRVSFAFKQEETLFENVMLFAAIEPDLGNALVNEYQNENENEKRKGDLPVLTDEEKEKYDNLEWRGIKVKRILDTYIEAHGEPTEGEIHNFYNEMVKYFRGITDNNKRCLLHILPRFGHTEEECWSQIKSICKVNTLSSLPKDFYFFLKDNGFYVPSGFGQGALQQYMMSDKPDGEFVEPPYLPPVIRELVSCAPRDFVIPSINALLPIIGTLTSYVGAEYPYDNRLHTTSFFSVIYAPPGTGKGFVERFNEILHGDLELRDAVQNKKDSFYLEKLNKKGGNEKSPDNPNTSLRIMEPKNSESEFLEKQRNNRGFHMYTYAAEMDTWAKGIKSAGGNKDDMVRVAWDNGIYGQYYKNAGTFKGKVRLFWNVLITGTLEQIQKYFKNVENGLVTRCSFTSIENQQFVEPPIWKQLNPKALKTIEDFKKRCDENTYETPCKEDKDEVECMTEEQFENDVDWHFKFKERQIVELDWVMPEIRDFLREQIKQSALDVDVARDVFRRRVAVRGFRLALMCTCLYNRRMTKIDIANCRKFIRWWMERDLEGILKLWGHKYNEQVNTVPVISQKSVFDEMPSKFTKSDVYASCIKQGIKTPVRNVIYNWKRMGYIERLVDDTYQKINQKTKDND